MRSRIAVVVVILAAGCTHTLSTTRQPVTCEWGGGKISGIVVDRAGKPVENLEIHAMPEEGDVGLLVKTDAAGRFDFGCVGAMRFQIGSDISRWGRISRPLTVHRGEEIRLKVVLRTRRRLAAAP